MTRVVRCTCGVEIRDAEEARLIDKVQQHAKEAHALDMSEEQVRAMYKQMVKITVTPTWVKLIDFVRTLPRPVEEIIQAQQACGA